MSDILAKVKQRFPSVALIEPSPVYDIASLKVAPGDYLSLMRFLKEDMDFEYLDFLTAVDWKGAVDVRGYITDPNPNPFLPEGATPEIAVETNPKFPYRDVIELVVILSNWKIPAKLCVRAELSRSEPKISSLSGFWKGADWQERETFDLLGVHFEGHHNLTKILTPDFTQGHPLRKDYVHVKDKYD
ncbi:MAG: NADH-quinone oxidoreductase subunit C [Elusimicrobia bacterium]|nr:NADH-quinone oxidoreductase subunit C [Elusimicrobiota bacterium]